MKSETTRNTALDVLRFTAVAMVVTRHVWVCPEQVSAPLHHLTAWLSQVGWIGVDMFFVLSGFLISSLLFTDYQLNGSISVSRFYIRRGFKIYPTLFVFMLTAACVILWKYAQIRHVISNSDAFWRAMGNWLWPNLLFLQNYMDPAESNAVWSVKLTWSLAVEEHFYLFLPLLLVLLLGLFKSIRSLPYIFVFFAIFCLFARLSTTGEFTTQKYLMPTHLRFDSLFFGVLLSYWKHFCPALFSALCKRWRWLIPAGVLLFMPVYFTEMSQSRYIYTFGYTQIYLGAGALLVGFVGSGMGRSPVCKMMAFVGARSYSIYLWHAAAAWIAVQNFNPTQTLDGWVTWVACYVTLTLLLGIGSYYIVELPMLRVRDKLFPALVRRQKVKR